MTEKTLSIRNDVPGDFLELFANGGPFRQLSELARTPGNTVDLQFRNTQGKKPWATLYLGTSKIVDMYFSERRGLKIKPQKSQKVFKPALDDFWDRHSDLASRWDTWQPVGEAAEDWRKAGTDLIDTLSGAEERARTFTGIENEGYLQAGIAKPGFFDRWSVVNRESIVSFVDEAQRDRVMERVQKPLDTALRSLWELELDWPRSRKGFGELRAGSGRPKNPKGFGNKLDALAIDNDGNLLAIEVKGGYDIAGVGWTPAQVMVYKRILEVWRERTSEDPNKVLEKALEQRRELGLAGTQELAVDFKIIPVIVIGEIASSGSAEEATRRMEMVRSALEQTTDDLEDLRVYQLAGEGLACSEINRGEHLRVDRSE